MIAKYFGTEHFSDFSFALKVVVIDNNFVWFCKGLEFIADQKPIILFGLRRSLVKSKLTIKALIFTKNGF